MPIIQKEKKILPTTKEGFKKFFQDKYVLALDRDENTLIYYKHLFPKSAIFNNSVEALAVSEIQKFDLFILELYQYPLSALEVLEKFKKLEKNSNTPTFLLCASVYNKELFEKFDYYLFKPVKALDLYFAAHNLIQK
jgi:CheY-like chemotaxis protein